MFLTAAVAEASCTYLGVTEGAHEVGATSTTFHYTFWYNCGGELYIVSVSETVEHGTGSGSWEQTITTRGGSTTSSGSGSPPVYGNGNEWPDAFDPRQWLAEADPEY